MNAPHSQKNLCCFKVQTKALEMHTGSLAAVGESYEAALSSHSMQGVGLEILAKNREAINARIKFKSDNVVRNLCGETSNPGLNVFLVGNEARSFSFWQAREAAKIARRIEL